MIKDEVERQFWIDQFNKANYNKAVEKSEWADYALKELQKRSSEIYIRRAKAIDDELKQIEYINKCMRAEV